MRLPHLSTHTLYGARECRTLAWTTGVVPSWTTLEARRQDAAWLKVAGIGGGGLIALAILLPLLGTMFSNSFDVFLIFLIAFLALVFAHGRRAGGDHNAPPE